MPSEWSEIRNNLNLTQEEWDKIEAEKSLIREQVKRRKEHKMSELEIAIKKFEALTAGALMSNVLYGYPSGRRLWFLALTALRAQLERDSAPTIAPVRGEWVHDGHNFCSGVDWCHCSVCGMRDGYDHAIRCNYCPNCGSKMGGE